MERRAPGSEDNALIHWKIAKTPRICGRWVGGLSKKCSSWLGKSPGWLRNAGGMVAECGNAVVGQAESHSETHSSSPGELVNCVRLITAAASNGFSI